MLSPEPEIEGTPKGSWRDKLWTPHSSAAGESESGMQYRRFGSLRLPKPSETSGVVDRKRFRSPSAAERFFGSPTRTARYNAPAPEYLARSLLQLGCPAVSMPTPRGRVGPEPPHSSDSDDYSGHSHRQQQQQQQQQQTTSDGQRQGHGQAHVDGHIVPRVQVSGPPNPLVSSSVVNGSAGSIGARSAPNTPLQATPGASQTGQQSITGSQLTVAAVNHPQPPKSPSHASLKCNDYLSKPLSKSTPSMAAGSGAQTPAKVNRSSSTSSPTFSSSGRQKKFHRHFKQVAEDERVLNYYSCALVGDILLQGHLYITPNYFAFYSNVFGYVTKLLIPTATVQKISKEKTARIFPNAVAVATEAERHVFCSLLSRDSTFKLMKQVWDAVMEPVPEVLPIPVEEKLLPPDTLSIETSEVNPEEDESSMSESGADLTSRPPTAVCTDTDGSPADVNKPSLPPPPPSPSPSTVESPPPSSAPHTSTKFDALGSLLTSRLTPGTVITILVAVLAALYVSAALMMIRIDRLHTAYLNHPLVSPDHFTHERLLHYLNTNLDQIVKVRQSLQTLSQQFVTMNQGSGARRTVPYGTMEPEDAPS